MEQTIPKMFRSVVHTYPEVNAQYTRSISGSFTAGNYLEFYHNASSFAASLLSLGVTRGERIGLISENRREWQQTDMGLLSIGAIDCPRGSDATEKDLVYILSFAECRICIAENSSIVTRILNVIDDIKSLKILIVFDTIGEDLIKRIKDKNLDYYLFDDLVRSGHDMLKDNPLMIENEIDKGTRDEIASIIFTSGTTGTPKGVMLSHGNYLSQLDELIERIPLEPGDKALCILPVWHAYQRACEYVVIAQGAGLCYSKPVGSIILNDLATLNPQMMPAVPRVWEAIYDGIWKKMRNTGKISYLLFRSSVNVAIIWSRIDRKLRRLNSRFGNDYLWLWWPILFIPWIVLFALKCIGDAVFFSRIRKLLGTNFKTGIVGGGAFPKNLDEFYWAVGIKIVEGYGLTETSPIVSVRPCYRPVFRNVGRPLRNVEVRVVDDEGLILPRCHKGILQVKGETVMKGYYKREDLTRKVMTVDGWFDTGDIAILTVDGEIQLRGRKKDTIVLYGGENIEPLPIEQKLNTSRYIQSSVVIGTDDKGVDQRTLGALILPVQDEILSYAKENGIQSSDYKSLVETPEIKKLIASEINSLISTKTGFKTFERIYSFEIITKPFEVGVELSAKQDMVRYRICELYKDKIAMLFR